ncbi:hypothetical protein ETU09_02620 [Apibacter muscae]|uniref:Lipocalin-like domain-containing protein n=1 Tax=Apibacter muscae TaxID=2509004 RepID=A0A563DJA8_9FLAO|nr:hypothetical protein [Apibacter muscae]TWP29894.1 hypothetical protein ETU09_02620 [Apibacter muscae]
MKNIFYYIIFMLILAVITCNCYSNNTNIIGIWKGCIIDYHTKKTIDSLKMEFKKDNLLNYKIGFGKNEQTINLRFRIDEQFIYTRELNSNEEDKAKYSIENDSLILDFEGLSIKLLKIQ